MLSAGLTTIGASPTHSIHSVSSTRCGFSFAPTGRASVRPDRRQICSAPMIGRSKPRPYSAYFQHNTSQKTPFGRRVAPRCDLYLCPLPLSAHQLGPQAFRRYGCGGVPEVQLLWVTPRSASERLNVGTQLQRYPSSFGDARL